MTDEELLDLCAKSAELHIDKSSTNGGGAGNTGFTTLGPGQVYAKLDCHNGIYWSPLHENKDAFALIVKRRLLLEYKADHIGEYVVAWDGLFGSGKVPLGADPEAATRRAIVLIVAWMEKNQ